MEDIRLAAKNGYIHVEGKWKEKTRGSPRQMKLDFKMDDGSMTIMES